MCKGWQCCLIFRLSTLAEGGEEVYVALSCLIPESHGLMFHLLHLKSEATCVYMRVFIFVFFLWVFF